MTVSDLTPMEFYGLVMLAVLLTIGIIIITRTIDEFADTIPRKIMAFVAIGFLVLPAFFGAKVLWESTREQPPHQLAKTDRE